MLDMLRAVLSLWLLLLASARRSLRQVFVMASFAIACAVMPACECSDPGQAPQGRPILACEPQHERIPAVKPPSLKTTVPGAMAASFGVVGGDATLSLPLVAVPGRAGVEPDLRLSYASAAGDGVLGVGFSLSGASAITRCPKTLSLDGEIRSVQYDADDALCLDGKRLVIVAQSGSTIEYRTFPDTLVKVIGHFDKAAASSLEAFLPSGDVIAYGKTPGTRPMASGNVPRAWLAGERRDARGNAMQFGYCFAKDPSGYVAEYALDEIRYTSFDKEEPARAVALTYAVDNARTAYSRGMAFQQSLRLDKVDMLAPGHALARTYTLTYEQSDTTGRTVLTEVEECGGDGACKLPTRFHYTQTQTGFDEATTTIEAPLSRRASYMLGHFSGAGIADFLVPDTTGQSTPAKPITRWSIARNQGGSFAALKDAFLQEWSFQQEPSGPSDPSDIQPELGTPIDYDQNGTTDVLLHDVYGNRNNHIVLTSKADGTLEELDTGIARPFPVGPAPKGLRSSAASVHLADVTGDGVADLIQCTDHGDAGLLATWRLHAWRPGGFEQSGNVIAPLDGYSCGMEVHTVDIDHNGITDLVMPGMIKTNGVPSQQATTFSVFRRQTNGTWEAHDTKLDIPLSRSRTLFVDVNGDGLPDAVNGDVSGRLWTWINTGNGFSDEGKKSVQWDALFPQTMYLHLATPLDWDGDGRMDILLPMRDGASMEIPRWVILRAVGDSGEYTFERSSAGIPFEAVLGDAVTLADPRGPRIGDVNGDGAPDVAIFLENVLHIFKNRAGDADVLIGYSDGTNDHDVDEPGFIPNVSFVYGHLTDAARMENRPAKESDFYISRWDAANDCAYPRHCAVGPKRVVRAYAVNDGQGGVRRFGLRYRDGRTNRLGHGFLGFGERILTDLDTGASTAEFYDNATAVKIGSRDVVPFAGQVKRQWHYAPGLSTQPKPDQVEMVFADRTIDVVPTNGGASYFTLPTKLHSRRMQGSFSGGGSLAAYIELVESLENATMLRDSTVEVLDYDEHRNVLEVNVSTVGVDLTTHVKRTVKNDVSRWILGQPQWQEECSSAAGLTQCRAVTRTTNAFGEVETESTSSNDGIDDTKLTVAYDGRDKYGNVKNVSADDAFGHHREATTVYDEQGIFPAKHINALGHETVVEYDVALGEMLRLTDPNKLVTEWEYDSFGNETLEKRPDGSQTTTSRTREKMNGVWRLKQRSTTTGGDDDETVYDSLARPVRTYAYGPAPKANTPRIMQVIAYDRLSGNVAKKSVPAAEGTPDAALLFDEYGYDALNRQVRYKTPWNATTATSYDGFLVDVTDPLQHHTITELDALQRPVVVTDAANGKTSHTYGPFNTLQSVTDPGGAVTKWKRDAFERVRQLEEPDRGTTTFVNSGFGDLLSSTDALGREVTWTPDALGRTKTRTDKQGAQVSTTTWTWDTAANGIGRLHWVKSPDAVKTYSYTKRGQPEGMTLAVGSESFAAKMTYDDVGRAKSLEYPSPLGEQPFGVTYDYDAHGFRIGVRDTYTNSTYWQLTDVDQAGRYKHEQFGNGVTTARSYFNEKGALKSITTTKGASTIQQLSYDWDEQLNLKSRTDALQPQHKTERFRYDGLDRLTCAYFSPNENPVVPCISSYGYAANGNLTSKSDVGILSYTDAKHPHAVTNAPGETYTYDAVGNQVTRPGGVVMTYTPFDLPKTIMQGGTSISFGYDGDERRIRKTTSTTETVYFDDLFEQVKTGNVKAYRYYVHSPERVVAIVTRGGNEPGTTYVHVDHLGSTETLTNAKGAPTEKRSYDPFGQRRNENWALPPPASFTNKTTKGFTGHEEDNEFGLVNMRGRMFDPRLGRFLSTDPIIKSVFDGQALNAFAYVRNNPLTLVDPSGFTEEEAWRLWHVEETGELGIHITFDQLTPPTPRPAPPAAVGAQTPTNDVDTTGSDDGADHVVLPIIETPHPSGPGTDDPFGVYPTDIELGYPEPITPFDQLTHGDPSGGRRTFIIEDETGLGRDLRHVYGPKRETIILRPRIGGVASDDESLAKQNLAFEAGITLITLLTPGPLDDIAAAGLRGATHLNKGTAVSEFGIYRIWITKGGRKELYKIGKADLLRITKSQNRPTRVHQQMRKLEARYGSNKVDHDIEKLGRVTTAEAKGAEKARLYEYYYSTGKIPPGNKKSFKP